MMSRIALLAMPLLGLLLLAAHFVHAGLWPVAVVCITAIALLWVPRPWAARTVQVVLALGTVEWILTAVTLAQMRIAHQQPYLRLLVILGSVAIFTACAALAFQLPALARRFELGARRSPGP